VADRALQLLGARREVLHELLVAARIKVGVLLGETAQQEFGDRVVPVGSAQVMVAIRADDLYVVAVNADDCGVEGPAAEVIDEDVPYAGVVPEHLVIHGRRDGLGDEVQHVESGDLPGLTGRFAFQEPEVRRHGDDHVADFFAGLFLCGTGQLTQDERRDRLRSVGLPVEGIVNILAHLPLDQLDDQVRGEHRRVLGLPAHHHVFRRLEVDDGGSGVLSHRALHHDRPAGVVHVREARIRGAEVNSVGSHVTSL